MTIEFFLFPPALNQKCQKKLLLTDNRYGGGMVDADGGVVMIPAPELILGVTGL